MIRESTLRSRLLAAAPRCDEPLSTIQNTRSLERNGSSPSTCLTSRPKGAMPVFGSHRPSTYPRRTSQAARYCKAPPRLYSFSIEAGRPIAGGREGWQRMRAWMLVFSSALRTWSLGPRNWPCHLPAYRSRIGPAFSAKWGSRGKIQYLYRHGLMASASKIRHTVLRLIGLPRACCTRAVTSASDCRLRGRLVSATNSQATALTRAWSSGGKNGLAASSRRICHGKIPRGPSLAPTSDLTPRQAHALACCLMSHVGSLVQQQGQLVPLDGLMRGGLTPDRNACLL